MKGAALAQLCKALQGLHVAVDNTIVGKFVTCLKDELRKLPLEVDALFAYRDVLQSIVGGFVQKDPHDEMLERFESWTSATKNENTEDVKEDSVDDVEVFLNTAHCTPSLQAYMNIHAAVHAAKNATRYDGRVYDESVAHPLTVEEFNAMVACLLSGPLMECLIRNKMAPCPRKHHRTRA